MWLGTLIFYTTHSQIGILPPGNVWRHFWLSTTGEGDATGIWWVEASGVTQRPAVRGLPSQQVCLVQNVNHFATSVPLSHSVHPGNSQIRAVSQGSFYWVHNNEGGSAYTFCLLYQIFK